MIELLFKILFAFLGALDEFWQQMHGSQAQQPFGPHSIFLLQLLQDICGAFTDALDEFFWQMYGSEYQQPFGPQSPFQPQQPSGPQPPSPPQQPSGPQSDMRRTLRVQKRKIQRLERREADLVNALTAISTSLDLDLMAAKANFFRLRGSQQAVEQALEQRVATAAKAEADAKQQFKAASADLAGVQLELGKSEKLVQQLGEELKKAAAKNDELRESSTAAHPEPNTSALADRKLDDLNQQVMEANKRADKAQNESKKDRLAVLQAVERTKQLEKQILDADEQATKHAEDIEAIEADHEATVDALRAGVLQELQQGKKDSKELLAKHKQDLKARHASDSAALQADHRQKLQQQLHDSNTQHAEHMKDLELRHESDLGALEAALQVKELQHAENIKDLEDRRRTDGDILQAAHRQVQQSLNDSNAQHAGNIKDLENRHKSEVGILQAAQRQVQELQQGLNDINAQHAGHIKDLEDRHESEVGTLQAAEQRVQELQQGLNDGKTQHAQRVNELEAHHASKFGGLQAAAVREVRLQKKRLNRSNERHAQRTKVLQSRVTTQASTLENHRRQVHELQQRLDDSKAQHAQQIKDLEDSHRTNVYAVEAAQAPAQEPQQPLDHSSPPQDNCCMCGKVLPQGLLVCDQCMAQLGADDYFGSSQDLQDRSDEPSGTGEIAPASAGMSTADPTGSHLQDKCCMCDKVLPQGLVLCDQCMTQIGADDPVESSQDLEFLQDRPDEPSGTGENAPASAGMSTAEPTDAYAMDWER